MRMFKIFSHFFLLIVLCHLCSLFSYEIEIIGVEDPNLLKLIHNASQLEKLKDNPPATLTGLKRRAENDILSIVQALHSQAHYNAKATYQIKDGDVVELHINPGPTYPFANYDIHFTQDNQPTNPFPEPVCLKELGIIIGASALPETIVNAEEHLLDLLNFKGYAFAEVTNREVLVDQQKETVSIILSIETGPLAYFGSLSISGLDRVDKSFIYKKLQWNEGDLYDPEKVEKAQEALEMSGLFRSVHIDHAEQLVDEQLLPISIAVTESKQRSIGFGVNYMTELGPGITGEWEDRNFSGQGDKVGFRLDLWKLRQEGMLTYVIPDFMRKDQNLIWLLDYHHDMIKAFTDSTLSLSCSLERKINEHLRFSYGLMYKLIRSKDSDFNGTFDLLQVPLQLRWSNANSLLDPTSGGTITFKSLPSLQFVRPYFAYCVNTFTATYYQSLTSDDRHILAAKLMLGSIFGASKHDIPPPERFYAGSENTLRGYEFMTVSPIGDHHKPLGGRSLFAYSLELRNRVGKNWGWVAFYEFGNVYEYPYPDFTKPFLQSVGAGIRYYTPVGPLRLDVAVPLNRRPHIDAPFQIYFSIGQTF